jgi:hypothetical protein
MKVDVVLAVSMAALKVNTMFADTDTPLAPLAGLLVTVVVPCPLAAKLLSSKMPDRPNKPRRFLRPGIQQIPAALRIVALK